MNFNDLNGDHFWADESQYVLIRPANRPGFCDPYLFVWRDFTRVFIDGGQFGFTENAREADAVEIEALAERFDLEPLRRVLANRRDSRPPAQP